MRPIDADKLKAHYAWWNEERREVFDTIVDMQPTIDAEPVRHGHWVNPHWHNANYCCDCSGCHAEAMHAKFGWHDEGIYPICPNCGAKMDEVSE